MPNRNQPPPFDRPEPVQRVIEPRDPSEGDSVSTTTLSEAVIRVLGQSASISRDDLAAELSDASKEALSRVIKRAIDDQRVRELADGQLEVATAPLVGGGSRR